MTRLRALLPAAVLGAALLVITACAGGGGGDTAGESRVQKLLGGGDAFELVAGGSAAGKVTAVRVDGTGGATGDSGQGDVAGFPIISAEMQVSEADADALGRILTDDGTYDWERAKGCKFQPGVVIHWSRRRASVDAAFCFTCDEVAFLRNEKYVGQEDFDSRRPDIVRIVKRLFPDDIEIQALAE